MAEVVLELLLDNFNSLVQKELGLFLGFEKDFKSVSSLITTIKSRLLLKMLTRNTSLTKL